MARVNIVKRIKINGRWVMRSIPRKQSGNWDWNSLPDGRYYVEWYEQGKPMRRQLRKSGLPSDVNLSRISVVGSAER